MSKIKAALQKASESKSPLKLIKTDQVYYMVLNSKDNRINSAFCDYLHIALDEIDADADLKGKVMLTLSTHPKIFSNGFDIPNFPSVKAVEDTFEGFGRFMCRMMSFKIPTVAMVNGHAFAGGWFLGLAHDYR